MLKCALPSKEPPPLLVPPSVVLPAAPVLEGHDQRALVQAVTGKPFLPPAPWRSEEDREAGRWISRAAWVVQPQKTIGLRKIVLIHPTVIKYGNAHYFFDRQRSMAPMVTGDSLALFPHSGAFSVVLFFRNEHMQTNSMSEASGPIWLALRVCQFGEDQVHALTTQLGRIQSKLRQSEVIDRSYRGFLPIFAAQTLLCTEQDELLYTLHPAADADLITAMQIEPSDVQRVEKAVGFPFLARVCASTNAWMKRHTIHVALQLIRAVRELHEMGLVHADIKLENVLLRGVAERAPPLVYLCDFDSMQSLSDRRPTPRASSDPQADDSALPAILLSPKSQRRAEQWGTPEMWAPERSVWYDATPAPKRKRIYRPWTPEEDVWSLGLSLLMLFTCSCPDLIDASAGPDASQEALDAAIFSCLQSNQSTWESYLQKSDKSHSSQWLEKLAYAFQRVLCICPNERTIEPLEALLSQLDCSH